MLRLCSHAPNGTQDQPSPRGGFLGSEPLLPKATLDQPPAFPSLANASTTGSRLRVSHILSALGPEYLVGQAADDWFRVIHPLAPILHRRRFLTRLRNGEMDNNPTFLGLVISVIAVTSASLRHENSPGDGTITPLRCAELIDENNLLNSDSCTVDWCVAHYNIAYALVGRLGLRDWRVFRAVKNSMTGVQWFLFFNTGEKTLEDEEIVKRLYWLLSSWDMCVSLAPLKVIHPLTLVDRGSDMMCNSHITLRPFGEPYMQLRPQDLTDAELNQAPASFAGVSPSADDDKHYVPGLNAFADVFMSWWHAKRDISHLPPEEALKRGLSHVQHVLSNLSPELRWRGGLSRPPGATWGHDAQMVQILVTSLYVKSNLLQCFGALPSVLTHRDIIRSVQTLMMTDFVAAVLEILSFMHSYPPTRFDATPRKGHFLLPCSVQIQLYTDHVNF